MANSKQKSCLMSFVLHIQAWSLLWVLGCFVAGTSASEVSEPVTVMVSVTYQDGSPAADIPIGAMKSGGFIFRDGQMCNTDGNGTTSFQIDIDSHLPYIVVFISGPGLGLGLEGRELLDWMDHAESVMKEYSPSPVSAVTKVLDGVSKYDVEFVLREAITVMVPLVDDTGNPVPAGFLMGSATRDMDRNHRSDDSPLMIGGIPKGISSEIFVIAGNPPSAKVWTLRLTAQQTHSDITLPPVVVEDYVPGDACLQLTASGRDTLRTLGTGSSGGLMHLIDSEASDILCFPIDDSTGEVRNALGDGSPCIQSGSYYPVPGMPSEYCSIRLRDALDRGVDVQSFGVPVLEFVPGQNPSIELDMTQIEEAIVAAYES